jgi:hypothetical protein
VISYTAKLQLTRSLKSRIGTYNLLKKSSLKCARDIVVLVAAQRIGFTIYFKTIINARISIMRATDKDNWLNRAKN